MKKAIVFTLVTCGIALFACKKSADLSSQVSLTASTTEAVVGQAIAVTVSSDVNASKWTVTPSTATKAYSITTSKTNYFTFNQAGVYTVSVSARAVNYDSTTHQSLDSCWNHTGHGPCRAGVDSASLKITVTQ